MNEMKSIFKLTMVVLLLFSATLAHAAKAEYTKQFRRGWTKSSVTALKITNKFGEIKINDTGGDSVTIKVVITVDNPSSGKAKELMNMIQVDFQKSGGLVSAETRIEDSFRSKQKFSIDYLINVPKDRELNITNRYGSVTVNELDAKGSFAISYGSMTAGKMKAPAGNPVRISISYGKADLETINEAVMEFRYSKLYAGEINQLTLNSRYSDINLTKTGSLTLDSKYDAVSTDEVDDLKSVSKYTNYKVGLLTGSVDLDTGYGSVRISRVDARFDRIKIVNSYGGINIGLNELNYRLQAVCDYCELNYPDSRYKGNRIRDNHRFSLDGNVGAGGGSVSITSRYGGVKLMD